MTLLGVSAVGQCPTQWLPGEGVPGVAASTPSTVFATAMWDPDGAGPLTARVVVGGIFTAAGNVLANNVVTWDPVGGTWAPLGSGVTFNGNMAPVSAFATLPNGDLVVGGNFTAAGGVPAANIARWNGTTWSALASGLNGYVHELAVLPNGDLVAGGVFTMAGGGAAANIARWNGTTWSALGSGITSPGSEVSVRAMKVMANGDLVVGGIFTTAGGVAARSIARWDGTTWSAVGTGMGTTTVFQGVFALTSLPNGVLVAGGLFMTAGGVAASNIASWDGTTWSALGAGVHSSGLVYSLATLPNGDVVAGGSFQSAGGVPATNLARWDGAAWTPLGSGLSGTSSSVEALVVLANAEIVAGGSFTRSGSLTVKHLARWSGSSWSPLATGIDGIVYDCHERPNGDLVVGGSFTTVGGVAASGVARWDGTAWSALGAAGPSGVVYTLATRANGDLIAGGYFSFGGTNISHIARWDGMSWSSLGSGVNGGVSVLAELPNGDLVAGGTFTNAGGLPASRIARWNGTSWSSFGSGANGSVSAMMTMPNGDLIVGGGFTTMDGVAVNRIARWNGVSWSAVGSGITLSLVSALCLMPNGDLVAGCRYQTAGGLWVTGIARWNGTTWSTTAPGLTDLTTSIVKTLTVLPNGDLLVGGSFTMAGSVPAENLARWDGTSWSGVSGGTNGTVLATARLANGNLAVAGGFMGAGGSPSAYLARLATTCPANAVAFGTGCAGSAGANLLAPTSLPWTGSTFHAVATGMPGNAFVLEVLGFGTVSIPLPSLLPQGQPGCTLHVSPDAVLTLLYLPTAGQVTTSLPIPNSVALAGLILHQQVVPVAFDLAGNILAATSTNALTLTIGTL